MTFAIWRTDTVGKLILVTGGSRSGKSRYAQEAAELYPPPRHFIATCRVCDREMEDRVEKHREARGSADWHTIEQPLNLLDALSNAEGSSVILIDCLTLWINNLLYEAKSRGEHPTAENIAEECQRVLVACRPMSGVIIFVTGEVGMGIVPDNPLARLYRDCVGTCNQMVAAAADTVTLVTCGIPLALKG
jgi:adenosylcobinamide kinase/adenosylcobinamide-phosphate guanylyltransferase